MPIYLSLAGQSALITGGSRGIGAATVRMFAAAGAQVVFSYQRARDVAEKLARECGAGCTAVQCDLNSPEAARGLIEEAVQLLGRLDVLVANQGIWTAEDVPIEKMTAEQWRRTMAVNLDSVFGLIMHAVAQMKRQRRTGPAAGRIVLVSSSSGQIGEALHVDYAASKGALISMAKGLSTELAPDGVYVNCVAPGWVETELVAPALQDAEKRRRIEQEIPLGRLGKPKEIATSILFLCTEYAGFVTGEVLNINGGEALVG
ncbi:MAG: SDR family NAD(P)-dependent oxidoreductase [Chlamydiota bacterium]